MRGGASGCVCGWECDGGEAPGRITRVVRGRRRSERGCAGGRGVHVVGRQNGAERKGQRISKGRAGGGSAVRRVRRVEDLAGLGAEARAQGRVLGRRRLGEHAAGRAVVVGRAGARDRGRVVVGARDACGLKRQGGREGRSSVGRKQRAAAEGKPGRDVPRTTRRFRRRRAPSARPLPCQPCRTRRSSPSTRGASGRDRLR